MDQEFIKEWCMLQDEAQRLVRAGQEEGLRGHRVVQLITMPAFTPSESFEVLLHWTHSRKTEYQIARTLWRIDLDQAKLDGPVERLRHRRSLAPTIECDTRSVSAEQVDEVRATFDRITVPLRLGCASAGCDGVFYELRVGSGFTETAVKWWCDPPEGWEELASAFHRIDADLRKAFV